MKKIAVTCNGKKVVEGLENCQQFEIYETENGQVEKEWTIHNPGYKVHFIPVYLKDIGVKAIIAGGMEKETLEECKQEGLEIIPKAEGNVEDNVESYLEGKLKAC